MATKPELKRAIANTKIKASDYNFNFEKLNDYIENGIADNAINFYEPDRAYKKGQWVMFTGENGSSLYESLIDGNKGNSLTDNNFWVRKTFGFEVPLLQSFWSDHILNRPDLLRADTFSWQSGKLYEAVYNELVAEYDNENCVEETEGGITFKRTPKEYKIADSSQETAILEKYNTDDIAYYYILDKDNTQFKLPRTKFGFEGLRDSVGNDIEAGLPNIEGSSLPRGNVGFEATGSNTGAFLLGNKQQPNIVGYEANLVGYDLVFDASKSNPTYGNSDTVQEHATQMYLYFYVGNYTQSAIEQTAGLNAELFNNKADKTEVDGEWVYPENIPSLVAEMSLNSSTNLELDLTEVLPKDNNIYECILSSGCLTGSTNGNYINIAVNASAMPSDRFINICGCVARGGSVATIGSTTIIIGMDRKLIVRRSTSFNGNIQYLYVIAYRKVR